MSKISCPICEKDDMVQKVTAIVQGETNSTSGYSSSSGYSSISGDHISASGYSSGYTRMSATQSSRLAQQLHAPMRPSAPEKPDVQRSIFDLTGIFVLAVVITVVLVYMFMRDMYNYFLFWGRCCVTFLLSGIGLMIVTTPSLNRKRAEAEKRYEDDIDLYNRLTDIWRQEMINWNKLYYCRRDDVVYNPSDSAQPVEPARMRDIL